MVFATGALGSLLPKLAQLLHGEYKLQKNVRKNIEFVKKELEHTQAALHSVSEVPPEQLTEQVKIWARDTRELSYDMEDVVDTFLVCVEGPDPPSRRSSRKFIQKLKSLLAVGERHHIGEQIKDIKTRVNELSARRERYKVDTFNPGGATVDPRIAHIYTKATDLVGINKAREELLTKLERQNIVSVVGFGGLGKTTLAKAVYDKIKTQFDCSAFVTVSRNPDMKKFLKDILYEMSQGEYGDVHNRSLDEKQLIDISRTLLHDKRYLIIIDDIWNTSHSDMIIKHALPDDNIGCKIIITTRNVTVAKHIGHAYEMQPLPLDSSRVLLYRRIIGIEDSGKCLDEKLIEISDRILKKCAGVPLAIITIASLLAGKGRNKIEWEDVYNSIGNGMENSLEAENMRKILSYSYYDLPFYLRTCLLYLSVFPEDFEIGKDSLICMWIAEGFIQPDKQWNKSLIELGETFFNELINRNMIQPKHYNCHYEIWGCHVHDMVLDLICSISSEENFISILSNMNRTSPSTMVRRLSLQNGKKNRATTLATKTMPLVRSAIVFPSALDQMPSLQCFKVLRVLDLQGCDLSHGYSLQYLGSLFHLRYLSLRATRIDQLPEEVGNLQYLKILDVEDNEIGLLPKCILQLKHLLHMSIDWGTRISNGIGSLTVVEKLEWLRIDDESLDNIHGLGLLTELRVISIRLRTDKCTDKLVESLCKLRKIQRLTIVVGCKDHQRFLGRLDTWVAPPQLRVLGAWNACWFLTLPAWLKNPTQFQDLVHLAIFVRELQQEDIEILGLLPALSCLDLRVDHENFKIFERRFVVGAGWFSHLGHCELWGFLWPLIFQQGAMPRLRELLFDFHVPEEMKIAGTGSNGSFDCDLGNLQSLEKCRVWVKGGANEVQVEEVTIALRRAAESHPNQLQFVIQ